MQDRTASRRVKRYRAGQRNRRIARLELQVPALLATDMKSVARRWRAKFAALPKAERHLDFILGTINAPRPRAIDASTLLACLLAEAPDPVWWPHIEALVDEVSAEALHDLVLDGVVEFEDLFHALRIWKVPDGRNAAWIREMADLRLANAAPSRARAAR